MKNNHNRGISHNVISHHTQPIEIAHFLLIIIIVVLKEFYHTIMQKKNGRETLKIWLFQKKYTYSSTKLHMYLTFLSIKTTLP